VQLELVKVTDFIPSDRGNTSKDDSLAGQWRKEEGGAVKGENVRREIKREIHNSATAALCRTKHFSGT